MKTDAAFDQLERLVKKGDLQGVGAWLVAGSSPDLANRFGWTPLMLAALHGRTDIARLLIENGADPRHENQFGDTAKSIAEVKGFLRTAEFIESTLDRRRGA